MRFGPYFLWKNAGSVKIELRLEKNMSSSMLYILFIILSGSTGALIGTGIESVLAGEMRLAQLDFLMSVLLALTAEIAFLYLIRQGLSFRRRTFWASLVFALIMSLGMFSSVTAFFIVLSFYVNSAAAFRTSGKRRQEKGADEREPFES